MAPQISSVIPMKLEFFHCSDNRHFSRKRLDIIIVSSVFPPEPVFSAKSSCQLAKHLAQQGHRVTVITAFPSRPSGKMYPGYRRRLYIRDSLNNDPDGIIVLRCFATLSKKSKYLSRIMENISFGLTSALAVLRMPKANVVYANTWPLFASAILAVVTRIRKIPLVTSVQDVYPESLVAQGRLKRNRIGYRMLRWIDISVCRSATSIVLISRSFRSIYEDDRGIDPQKITVIPNWHDENITQTNENEIMGYREQWGIQPCWKLILYGGNVGVAAGVDGMIHAMKKLSREKVVLVIAGDGSELSRCRELASKLQIENIRFHSPWLRSESASVLGSADILILPTRGEQSFASMPSKLVSYIHVCGQTHNRSC